MNITTIHCFLLSIKKNHLVVFEKRYVCQQLVIALCGGINSYAESFLAQIKKLINFNTIKL